MQYGLYLHIPFCRQKCFYCDFPSYAGMESLQEAYLGALRQEIKRRSCLLSPTDIVDTIYFGGGTPTVLTGVQLQTVLAAVQAQYAVAAAAEITIEANPGTVDREKLMMLRQSGVNRISFGVQSFSDRLLREIGRIHTAAEARQAIELATDCGFTNISIDLMYGLPTQTLADLQDSIAAAAQSAVAHISVYGLKVEAGTAFARRQARGTLQLPDEDTEEAMYEYIMQALPANGYQRYEISNFAKPGMSSRHNFKYWQNQPYIGLGAAAHAYYADKRWANPADVREYIAKINGGSETQYITEELDEAMRMEEFCFLGLRTVQGISIKAFEKIFRRNIFSIYGDIINRFVQQQLLVCEADRIYLTERGMKYGNQVFQAFLLK